MKQHTISRRGAFKRALLGLGCLGIVAPVLVTLQAGAQEKAGAAKAAGKDPTVIGLALTDWHVAGNFKEDSREECPAGLAASNRENWLALYKTEAERKAHLEKYGEVESTNRGPDGENSNYFPWLVKEDPIPFKEVKSKISDGLNLDGTEDGNATGQTCAHEKFTAPDGKTKVDNQVYRVLGCVKGMRVGGFADQFFSSEIKVDPINRVLIEITGVDDPANDDHVEVNLYKGMDKLVQDSRERVLPWFSQRIDPRLPEYTYHTTGKIVNHVLTTEPLPMWRFPIRHATEYGERRISDARLRLELTEDGAKGVVAGYQDVEHFYLWFANTVGNHNVSAVASSPSVWASMNRNADGQKDAKTGQCKALSAAYAVDAVRVFVIHPPKNPQLASEPDTRETGPAK